MTPSEAHDEVIARDDICFLFRIQAGHICRDAWGRRHEPSDRERLTVDRVKEHPRMGVGESHRDPTHLIAMCYASNVGGPSKEVRAAERAYLARLYPSVWEVAA